VVAIPPDVDARDVQRTPPARTSEERSIDDDCITAGGDQTLAKVLIEVCGVRLAGGCPACLTSDRVFLSRRCVEDDDDVTAFTRDHVEQLSVRGRHCGDRIVGDDGPVRDVPLEVGYNDQRRARFRERRREARLKVRTC
jgi:hypothetical protein